MGLEMLNGNLVSFSVNKPKGSNPSEPFYWNGERSTAEEGRMRNLVHSCKKEGRLVYYQRYVIASIKIA